ncbi:hypothetical protein GCM10023188_19160 [Pontibacter saemangeumensis]|uniref:histidine kinase n=1 Tax=Pontibacter saemangeumensis TaxID=1084525 RepID=A0ABP8LKL5_9BACT
MLHINEISAAYAYSGTPHLVLSCQPDYTLVAVNAAYCDWCGGTEEDLLHQGIFSAQAAIADLTGLPEERLVQTFQQVVSSRSPTKLKVERFLLPGRKAHYGQRGGLLEIYPIVDNDQTVYLVLALAVPGGMDFPDTALSARPARPAPTAHQSLEVIFDSLANVLFVLEIEAPGLYRFSFANRAFQVTTGLPVERVIGSYVHDIIPEPSLALVREKYREAIQTKEQVSWQEVSDYPTGQKTGEVSVVPVLDDQGNCLRLVGMVHDITEHKEAEAKQHRLAQDLYRHNRDLRQFTYIVSHNLRAPVANLLGLVRHLPKVEPGTDLFQQYTTYLTTSVEKLDAVLTDINMVLSIRDRQRLADPEPIALADVCRQAGQDLATELAACGGRLSVQIDPGFTVRASQAYLYSIFHNLISNAIKYRSSERALQINVTSYRTAELEKVMQFSDNGSGFDMNRFGNDVFKLYKRFHGSGEGRGIGLFLVKTHVEAIGGYIKVQSEPSAGTTFTIHFKAGL